ncbi:MAG: DUF1203 domain-containing protein [Caulobacteraceae bacterium]|nr:DUF1203 domain-containing protein [Caulobacteraceae bacterium]
MKFAITGLPVERFSPLFGLSPEVLAARQIVRQTVDSKPGFPCRVTLEDAEPGETVLLLNHEHQSAPTPYRASHAIFVREAAKETVRLENEIPEVFLGRRLSIRAFDAAGMMVGADLCDGQDAPALIERLFADEAVAYLHAHNAGRGCYAARIDRA